MFRNSFQGKKVAVLGFGMEGKDLAKFLLKNKADVTVLDRKKEKELDFSGIDRKKVNLTFGEDYLKDNLSGFDIVFRSPGVYRFVTKIVEAEKRGAEISSGIKLFFDLCPAKIIGVTGTKGKGTTSTLIYQILKKAGFDVYLAGNIGKPYLSLLPKLKDNSLVVLELSSFQLIDLTKSPHISVVLNITVDHLDWHKDRNEYIEAKTQIVRHQNKDNFVVLNFDYKDSKNFEKLTKARVYYFSKEIKVKGCYISNGTIHLLGISSDTPTVSLGRVDKLPLRGKHNWENVSAAACASYLAGADIESIRKVIFSFKGLEHRLELVRKISGVSFYNDSFSTNPQTTIAAINSFNEPVTLILGGSDKGLNYDEMGKVISKKENVKTVILIGDIADIIEKSIKKAMYQGKILMLGRSSIEKIVKIAYENTERGGVVLLSPATASFDMFENYKDRGEKFKAAIDVVTETR